MKHVKCYKKDYPRPQFVREDWLNLNGIWDFVFDDENRGEQEEWYNEFPKEYEIEVPFAYQTQSSGIHDETQHMNVWYKKTVTFTTKQLSQRVLLNIEGSDYVTKVWINGHYVGIHVGGYERFSFDISRFVAKGANQIVFKVEDSYNCCQPRGKQRWQDANFGCWYVDTTGIWKTVWCEFLEQNYLNDIKITPNYETFQVRFDYTISRFEENLTLETVVTYDGQLVNNTDLKIIRQSGSYTIDATTDTEQFKMHTWSPNTPNLYDVEFYLKKDQQIIDHVGSYFGFRKLDSSKQSINLNDQTIYLKMLLDQGYWKESGITPPSEEALIIDIQKTLEMGFNGIRKHQKIEDERFYYYCDILGVYVWLEMPSAYEYKDETLMNFTNEWLQIVKQHINHPSIITWVPFNESWGVPRIKTDFSQQKFTEGIYYLTKSLDPHRFVISNDGWEHTKSDIITLHNYSESGDGMKECYGDMKQVLSNNYVSNSAPRHAFSNGYHYEGQPIMISEYAGIAFQKDNEKGWGYGQKVKDEKEFLNRLRSLTEAIKDMKEISGYCVTQTTDVEQEVNGLLTTDRKAKVDIEKLRKIILNKNKETKE